MGWISVWNVFLGEEMGLDVDVDMKSEGGLPFRGGWFSWGLKSIEL